MSGAGTPVGLGGSGEIGGTGDAAGSGAVRSGAIAVVPEGGAARGATAPGGDDKVEPDAEFAADPGSSDAAGGLGGAGGVGEVVFGSVVPSGGG